jgi:hypothetical protein
MKTSAIDTMGLLSADAVALPQYISGFTEIETARLMVLKQAVRLESVGMKHSSGRSMRKVACRALSMRTNTSIDNVLGALNREIDKRLRQQREAALPDVAHAPGTTGDVGACK